MHSIKWLCCPWLWVNQPPPPQTTLISAFLSPFIFFGPPLTALRYGMYFRFCGWRHVFTWRPWRVVCIATTAIEHDEQNSRRDYNQILLNDEDRKYFEFHTGRGRNALSTITSSCCCYCLVLIVSIFCALIADRDNDQSDNTDRHADYGFRHSTRTLGINYIRQF